MCVTSVRVRAPAVADGSTAAWQVLFMPVQLVLRLEEERQDDGELSGMAGGGSGNAMGGGNQAGPEECNTLFLNCNFSLGSTSSERDVVNNNQNVVLHCRECLRRLGLIPWLHCCERSQSRTLDAIALWKEDKRKGRRSSVKSEGSHFVSILPP